MVNNQAIEKYKLGFLIAMIMVSFFGLILFIQRTSGVQKNINLQRYELASLRAEVEALDKVLTDKQTFEPKSSQVIKSLPADFQEVVYFVEEIEKAATLSAVPLELKIDREAKEESRQLESVGFSLTSRGSYVSLSQILSILSNLPFHTKVTAVKMEQDGGQVSSVFDFKVFIWEKATGENGKN